MFVTCICTLGIGNFCCCSEGAESPTGVSASVSTHLILSMLRSKTTKTLQLCDKVLLLIVAALSNSEHLIKTC